MGCGICAEDKWLLLYRDKGIPWKLSDMRLHFRELCKNVPSRCILHVFSDTRLDFLFLFLAEPPCMKGMNRVSLFFIVLFHIFTPIPEPHFFFPLFYYLLGQCPAKLLLR